MREFTFIDFFTETFGDVIELAEGTDENDMKDYLEGSGKEFVAWPMPKVEKKAKVSVDPSKSKFIKAYEASKPLIASKTKS